MKFVAGFFLALSIISISAAGYLQWKVNQDLEYKIAYLQYRSKDRDNDFYTIYGRLRGLENHKDMVIDFMEKDFKKAVIYTMREYNGEIVHATE